MEVSIWDLKAKKIIEIKNVKYVYNSSSFFNVCDMLGRKTKYYSGDYTLDFIFSDNME